MRKNVFAIVILTSMIGFSQKRTNIFFRDFVECYYPRTISDSITIFDKIKGNIITKLPPLNNKHCYYKFAVSDSKKGWLKIENIIVLPGCGKNDLNIDISRYKGNWILATNLKIDIWGGLKLYKEPKLTSDFINHPIDYLTSDLIAINGIWAKISININGKKLEGWVDRKDQCAYPWTACPNNN